MTCVQIMWIETDRVTQESGFEMHFKFAILIMERKYEPRFSLAIEFINQTIQVFSLEIPSSISMLLLIYQEEETCRRMFI